MRLKSLIEEFIKQKEEKIIYDKSRKVLFVGDIHGDLDTIEKVKREIDNYDKIVFLGDYVDRGKYGYEVLVNLLELYFEFPGKIVLLRGNHEDFEINKYYGFYEEIMEKEPDCTNIIDFYESLSLIYINNKLKIFAVHGGISFVPKKIEDLLSVQKDLLWSDFNWKNPYKTTFNYYRGAGKLFGLDILKPFMKKFGFKYFVRGHECFENGYRIFNFNSFKLITVFSSSSGIYSYVNKKVLEINEEGFFIRNIQIR